MLGLEGKVAVITGAARGIGRSHAVRLAEEGVDIIALDVEGTQPGMPYEGPTPADRREPTRLVEALGRRVWTGRADVRSLDELETAIAEGVDVLGRLDIAIANAGLGANATPTEELSEATWTDMIDVNLNGAWRTTRAAVPHIKAGGRGGSIVFISSTAGLRGYPGLSHHAAAKHALTGLMRSIAQELGPHWIRVNCVHPTQVDTPMMMNAAGYRWSRPDLEAPSQEDFAVASQAGMALPAPWIEPRDVSNAVAFLVSDGARYVTGVNFPVDLGVGVK